MFVVFFQPFIALCQIHHINRDGSTLEYKNAPRIIQPSEILNIS